MTIPFSAAQGVRALKAEALGKHEAKQQRYYLKAGDLYLLQDASKLTDVRAWAWAGTMDQAVNCRRVHPAAAGCRTHRIISIPKHVQELA